MQTEPQHPPIPMNPLPSMSSTCIQVDLMDCSPVAYGGYSDIYKGKHEEEIVAIKVPRVPRGQVDSETPKTELDMVSYEANMLTSFPHSSIVSLKGVCDGQTVSESIRSPRCLVLPFAVGGDAEHVFVKKDVDFAKETKFRILIQVGEALESLHNRGVVHGDVKPRNILLDGVLNAKLCDFTHSHRIGATLPYKETLTARYAALELLVADDILTTTQSDVFAYGRTACMIMTGEQPPRSIRAVNWRPKAFRSLGPMACLLDRCLEINPSKRPTIAQVVIALREIANGCS